MNILEVRVRYIEKKLSILTNTFLITEKKLLRKKKDGPSNNFKKINLFNCYTMHNSPTVFNFIALCITQIIP